MADYVVLAEQDSVVVRVSANYVAATLAEIGETYKWMKNFPHMKNEPWAYAAFDLAIAGEQAIKIIKDLPSDDTLKSEAQTRKRLKPYSILTIQPTTIPIFHPLTR